jgi:ABC-type transporter Mla MlaB component
MTFELMEGMIAERNGRLSIQAPMNMDSAADCMLDLGAVPVVDSAALSVVLSLLRIAREAGHGLSIVNAPTAFGSIAALYGIGEILSEHLVAVSTDAHA